jgi:Flp pilus assembly protein TadB
MEDFPPFAWVFLVPIVAIIGAFTTAIVTSISRARVRELEIRERIAMIERGMVPAPEADPNGFERRMHTIDRMQHRHAGSRFRTGGITVMSVGFGLITLLWFVGVPREAIGVGGFLVIIGFGLFVNSLFSSPQPLAPVSPQRYDIPPGAPPASGPASVSDRPSDQMRS